MQREIYQVDAVIVDANGTVNTLNGYPKRFDSRSYEHDIRKTERRAYAEFEETKAALRRRDDRQLQDCWIIRLSDCIMLANLNDGKIADLPDPEPEPEEEPSNE